MTTLLNEQESQDLATYAKEQAQRVMGKIPLLGAVSWLMMQQVATRHTLLSELEWRVMPALVLDQAKLYMRKNAPVAYVSWARLSDDVAKRYQQAPHHLSASDWKSGEQIWIVDLCTPFGGIQEVMSDLRESMFAGQEIHQFTLGSDGQVKAMRWPAVTKKQEDKPKKFSAASLVVFDSRSCCQRNMFTLSGRPVEPIAPGLNCPLFF
jgi:cytolysin-activating lysine-acyltransferase